MLERFFCGLLGHRYVIERVIAPHWRKVGCTRCHQQWGMHDPARAFVLWDAEQQELAEWLHPDPPLSATPGPDGQSASPPQETPK